jgi:CBS domain-containing protein
MLTDRDITVRAVADGRDIDETIVGDVMTPDVAYCFEDQDVSEARRSWRSDRCVASPCWTRTGDSSASFSLGDLAVGTQDTALVGQTLVEVSVPAEPKR